MLKYISNTHHTDVQHIHTNRYTYNTRDKDSGIYIYILETTMMRVIILLICMNAFLMASIDASSIRGSAKGPGAEILSTIHTLEKTEEKAKDASADEELMKAQMKKQKEELKKLKANGLKQQQMITEMGEKAKEKEDRLKDISDTF